MKLTRKGLLKIVGDIVVNSPEHPLSETLENWNRARDFDQDDFEGVVILTVEESKRISMFFGAVDCCSSDIKLTEGEKNLWQILNNRIEQAEKCDG